MDYQGLEKQQSQILKEIYKRSRKRIRKTSGILKELQTANTKDIFDALGDHGEHLHRLIQRIDVDHPDIISINKGHFSSSQKYKFSREACDRLKLARLAKEHNLSPSILDSAKNRLYDGMFSKEIYEISDPVYSGRHIRFLNNSEDIRYARSFESVHSIVFHEPNVVGQLWSQTSENLLKYSRNQVVYETELSETKNRIDFYLKFGLNDFARHIQNSFDQIQTCMKKENYYGFNKISLETASIILSKMSGYSLANADNQDGFPDNVQVFVTPNTFGGYKFWVENDHLYDPNRLFNVFGLVPRAHPYHELENIAPKRINELIQYLDCFPDIGNRPLFDNYLVLIPGIYYPEPNTTGRYRLPNGELSEVMRSDLARIKLDREFLAQGILTSALVGIRDREMYFISYFA